MSAERQPPLLTSAQAASLLDQVVYEQVLECIDLDALYRLEQSLTMLVGEVDGVSADRIGELATAMLDRALLRLPDDVRRYLRAADWPPGGGCELCKEEEDEAPPDHQVPARRAPSRLKG
jgi:hypothetical protein